MTAPLFTVATLCYNHEPFLDDYFSGLLSQDYANVQLIIQDDCSTDASWEKIGHYLPLIREKFTEVICVRNEHNLGMWGAYLKLLTLPIRGAFFSVLESDDYYFPTRLKRIVEYFETHPDVGFVHSATLHFWDGAGHEEIRRHDTPRVSGWVFENLLQGNFVTQCSIAYRYETFAQIDVNAIAQRGYRFADYAVILEAARLTPFGYIDEVLAAYRKRPHSASRPENPIARYEFERSVRRVVIDAALQAHTATAVIDQLSHNYYAYTYVVAPTLGRFDDFEDAVAWLRTNDPRFSNSFKDHLRIALFTNRRVRETFRTIYYDKTLLSLRRQFMNSMRR